MILKPAPVRRLIAETISWSRVVGDLLSISVALRQTHRTSTAQKPPGRAITRQSPTSHFAQDHSHRQRLFLGSSTPNLAKGAPVRERPSEAVFCLPGALSTMAFPAWLRFSISSHRDLGRGSCSTPRAGAAHRPREHRRGVAAPSAGGCAGDGLGAALRARPCAGDCWASARAMAPSLGRPPAFDPSTTAPAQPSSAASTASNGTAASLPDSTNSPSATKPPSTSPQSTTGSSSFETRH